MPKTAWECRPHEREREREYSIQPRDNKHVRNVNPNKVVLGQDYPIEPGMLEKIVSGPHIDRVGLPCERHRE